MTLIFFQNCISPHQIPYISDCINDSRVDDVYLISPRIDYDERANMGWNSCELLSKKTIKYHINPEDNVITELLSKKNAIGIFSGIRADKNVFQWFNLSLKFQIKRYIITEAPFTYTKPLWLHYIRFYIQDYKYIKYISGIFAIGDSAVKYYKSISNSWNVIPFQYVTENIKRQMHCPEGKTKLVFVGSLSKRKNVSIVIKALNKISEIEFTIIGDGDQKNKLTALSSQIENKVFFRGKMTMKQVQEEMQKNDILILPSLHDGWGAVINEALTLGLFVIVSSTCGAKSLITNKENGIVFKSNDQKDLENKILFAKKHIDEIRSNTENRIKSAQKIQGEYISKYLIDSLSEE